MVRRTQQFESLGDGRLRLHFSNAADCDVDILIVAAGVRPNDSLARDCGLEVGSRGGIVIDDRPNRGDDYPEFAKDDVMGGVLVRVPIP